MPEVVAFSAAAPGRWEGGIDSPRMGVFFFFFSSPRLFRMLRSPSTTSSRSSWAQRREEEKGRGDLLGTERVEKNPTVEPKGATPGDLDFSVASSELEKNKVKSRKKIKKT